VIAEKSKCALDPLSTIQLLQIWHQVRGQELARSVGFDLRDEIVGGDLDLPVLDTCHERLDISSDLLDYVLNICRCDGMASILSGD
jgi:hypothetical protein